MCTKSFALGFAAATLGGISSLVSSCVERAHADETPARTVAATDVPVLVELFTSEGCSSCPPADEVLARFEKTQPVAGVRIVPLALHVDYWDSIGWPDPFAAPAFTGRQRAYASAIGGGVYTPEAVIDGRAQMTGSRGSSLESAIADAAKQPHASVGIDLAAGGTATIRVGALPAGAASDAEVIVAITQDRASVKVLRGENSGRTLDHTAITKELKSLGSVGAQGGTLSTTVKPSKDLRIVAFVQERASRKVLGASTRQLIP